ncbi:glycosyltransferase family 2 protein [Maribacter stanieri]|uniref:glycosyltransferase family 2 protein n=1 Tax=Maribacter stanieri TaxID=440514 RepID=UPI0024948D13|nr:glycosyltransferase family 2 protein [Maribacter stanieri]|tara:strand:+ start:3889 stop:4827 length:939 start_codon:yes stop_codon:yes gene_type:complete
MKISICIPTYKRPKLVIEAINSCLNQTYPPSEIIIGDDSPDNTTMIAVEKLKKKSAIPIKYLHNKPGLGQMANTNKLFDSISGDKVMLLHDDDQIVPDALESLINVFKNNPDVQITFGKQYIMTDDGEISLERSKIFNDSYFRIEKNDGSILTALESGVGQQFPNNGYLMDRHIVEKIKFRNYGFGDDLGNGCEYDFGLRIGIEGYKMYFLNKFTAKYRVAENSMSQSKSDDSGYQSFRILKDFKVNTTFAEKIRQQRLYERAPIAITQAIHIGKRKEAFSIYFSRWYRKRILSIGGLKRFVYLFIGKNQIK